MPSKLLLEFTREATSVLAALKTHREALVVRAEEVFTPLLQRGETLPDLRLVLTLGERLLTTRLARATGAEAAHTAELADDDEPRSVRERARVAVYSGLVKIKREVGALFGDDWLKKLKLPGTVPQDPTALATVAGDVHDAVESARLPRPVVDGVKRVDRAPWLALLKAPQRSLAAALADVAREAREAEATMLAKTRAFEDFTRGYAFSVALTEAFLRLVGDDELADRLRPTTPGPSASEPDDATDDPASASADAAGSGADPTGTTKPR